ncbi:MAG: hypothetical protein KDJ65_12900 [Anaerolineae bacterium]|nr:hypothetical protein [Anaerolineae bacterium]
MSPNPKIGVYFSANDVVYNWTIAFLNSFRAFNPNLRLILIPFNDNCKRLLALRDIYDFDVYQDPTFARLEALGQAFELGHTATGPYWFRRFAAFWGPLDRFMYLDARQVILADLQPLIMALDDHKFEFLHYDCALNQVYEPGPFRQSLLRQGRGRGFNSGRWISYRGLFSIDKFEELAANALKIRDQLNPRNTDQAFINYCCDTKPVCYGHLAEVAGKICQNGWARQPGQIYHYNGKYYLWDYGGLDHKKQVILIHWAGCKSNFLMPRRNFYRKYLLEHNSPLEKLYLNFTLNTQSLPQIFFEPLRRNRIFNTTYHHLVRILHN